MNGKIYIPKNKKILKNPCDCRIKIISKKIQCNIATEEYRQTIFKLFWEHMNWQERKVYIQTLVRVEPVKRRRGTNESSRRNSSFKYFLKADNKEIRVCKKMFLNTLVMKESTVLNWVRTIKIKDAEKNPQDKRIESRNQLFKNRNENLNEFFESLPKVESHYCRASTSKLYLEPMWTSTNELYRFYKENYCIENQKESVSRTVFFLMNFVRKITRFTSQKKTFATSVLRSKRKT